MIYDILDNGCWKCTSHGLNSSGYVVITINKKRMYGHRYMFEKYKGPITKEVIRHTCDNSWCINPDHLIEGTNQENVNDRVLRNRSAIGINNGRSKLSEEDVLEILKDIVSSKMELSRKYKIDEKVIRDIKNRKTWKHIKYPQPQY